MTTVFVTGLEFYGFHGVPDAEQKVGHRYIVDLELEVKSNAHHSDQLADSVDYGRVSLLALEIGTQHQYRTVERLAQVIGDAILTEFVTTQEVLVRVAKRLPPAPVIAEEAGVQLLIRRAK